MTSRSCSMTCLGPKRLPGACPSSSRSPERPAHSHASGFAEQVNALSAGAKSAEAVVSTAVTQLLDHLSRVEFSGTAAAGSITDANSRMLNTTDQLMTRAAASLEQIRSGIDTQAAAVASLVEQSSAGIGRTGAEAAESLASNVSAGQCRARWPDFADRRAGACVAADRGRDGRALAELDQHFAGLAETGDQRAAAFVKSIGRARGELQQLVRGDGRTE